MGHDTSQLEWFREYVQDARSKRVRTEVTYNDLQMHVTGDKFELGELGEDKLDEVETDQILEYINDAIEFINNYNGGKIKGLIPRSKWGSWSCVPNEFIKEEWWEKRKQEEK